MCGKRAAFFRDEFGEQIRFARSDQFLNLLFRNFPLQDHFADAECAGLLGGDGILAGVGIIEGVNLALVANGAGAERFMARGIDSRGCMKKGIPSDGETSE